MRTVGRWIGHLVGGMIQGFLVLGVIAAVVSVAFTLFAQHQALTMLTLTYIVTISLLAGLLGAACVLVWRLSHVGEFFRLAKGVSQHRSRRPKHA